MHPRDWKQVVDALPAELNEMILQGGIDAESESYARALALYHASDTSGLQAWIAEREKNPQLPGAGFLPIVRLRLGIRRNEVSDAEQAELLESIEKDPYWAPEALFVVAFSLDAQGKFDRSRGVYLQAATRLESIGCPRKALLARFNATVAETRGRTGEQPLLTPYHALLQDAERFELDSLVTQILQNLSHAFRALGYYRKALDLSRQSLRWLKKDPHTLSAYRAYLNHAFQCYELRILDECQQSLELCRASSFSEIEAGAWILATLLERKEIPVLPAPLASALSPVWKRRYEEKNFIDRSKDRDSDLQGELVHCLLDGPKSTKELESALYKDLQSEESRSDRLRQVLRMLRKRHPGLILYENSKYSIQT